MAGGNTITQDYNMNTGLEVTFDRAKCSPKLSHHVAPS